jgi:hypothetical protein
MVSFNDWLNATSVLGNCSPEMPLDQANSCLETQASGF